MTKFIKGVSGNPRGRPKNTKTISEALREILNANSISIEFCVQGKKKVVKLASDKNFAYGVAAKLVGSALEGNIKAIQTILDRMEGRPLQTFENAIELNKEDIIINFNK